MDMNEYVRRISAEEMLRLEAANILYGGSLDWQLDWEFGVEESVPQMEQEEPR